jgi:hypothetical protein
MTETTITDLTAEEGKRFGISPEHTPLYKLVTVTASDYDDGGNNSSSLSFVWPYQALPWENEMVQRALFIAEDGVKENLAPHVNTARAREKFFPLLARMVRREWRYFLSRIKLGKNIP